MRAKVLINMIDPLLDQCILVEDVRRGHDDTAQDILECLREALGFIENDLRRSVEPWVDVASWTAYEEEIKSADFYTRLRRLKYLAKAAR